MVRARWTDEWLAVLCLGIGLAIAGFVFEGRRLERAIGWLGLAAALGCGLIWLRSEWVRAPRLERPVVTSFDATVERVEPIASKGDLRLTLAPLDSVLPGRLRVSTKAQTAPSGIAAGAKVRVRARLAPPPPMALPGSHDFARDAWFRGLGAVAFARQHRSASAGGASRPRFAARPPGTPYTGTVGGRVGKHRHGARDWRPECRVRRRRGRHEAQRPSPPPFRQRTAHRCGHRRGHVPHTETPGAQPAAGALLQSCPGLRGRRCACRHWLPPC